MLPVPGGGHTGIGTVFVSVALCPASTWIGPNVCPSTTAVMSSGSVEQLVAVQVSVTGSPVHCRAGLHLRSKFTHGCGMHATSHEELAVAGGAGGLHWLVPVAVPLNVTLPEGPQAGMVAVVVNVWLPPAGTFGNDLVWPSILIVMSSGLR